MLMLLHPFRHTCYSLSEANQATKDIAALFEAATDQVMARLVPQHRDKLWRRSLRAYALMADEYEGRPVASTYYLAVKVAQHLAEVGYFEYGPDSPFVRGYETLAERVEANESNHDILEAMERSASKGARRMLRIWQEAGYFQGVALPEPLRKESV